MILITHQTIKKSIKYLFRMKSSLFMKLSHSRLSLSIISKNTFLKDLQFYKKSIFLFKLSLFTGIFLINCASGFRTKKLLHATSTSAFYELSRKEVSHNELIEGKLRHPYKISPEKLKDILGNIEFIKNTRINQYSDYIFYPSELDKFTIDLSLTLEKLKDTHIGVVITQHDSERSVISFPKRTSFLIFINEEGLNIVFGDIQQMVSREISYNFFDWTQIKPIGLKETPDENEIISSEDTFEFKKVKGYYNRKWLVFQLDNLDKYKFQPREVDRKNLEN